MSHRIPVTAPAALRARPGGHGTKRSPGLAVRGSGRFCGSALQRRFGGFPSVARFLHPPVVTGMCAWDGSLPRQCPSLAERPVPTARCRILGSADRQKVGCILTLAEAVCSCDPAL
ncbi:hypothetical protein AV530_015263 [Patagioenas fasciata monilis]|uniref:Uncharacterized protein n=1 Tax=Patagioenas fasciata monilis TaxID=372326 RepID=A0A1V4K1K7_PATFA|nr:hypothetical protein AV530_015263 [Patagioenas fasciata monilis]